MRPIRPGKYRHVVYVQKMDSVRDSDGHWINDWVDHKKKFADKKPIRGEEFFEAKAVNAVQTVSWKMRYDNTVKESMRIVEKDKKGNVMQAYDINAVLDLEGLHREMEVVTEAVIS